MLVNPALMRRDHVHVALDDHRRSLLADGVAGQVVAVEEMAFGKDIGVASVEVFRLYVAQGSAAETDDLARAVPNGKNQPVKEVVADSAFVGARQAGGLDRVVLETEFAQMRQQRRTMCAGVTQPELLDRSNRPTREIARRRAPPRPPASPGAAAAGTSAPSASRPSIAVLPSAPLGIGRFALKLDPGLARKFAQRVRELQAITAHDVREQISAFAAAKTLEAAAVGKDEERGCFLAMEGTQPLPVTTGPLQPQVTADVLDRVQPRL